MSSDTRRLILFTVVSMAILLGWQVMFPPPKTPPKRPETASAPAAAAPTGPEGATTAPPPGTAPVPPVEAVPDAPEELHVLKGADFEVTVSSHGGAVKHVVLQGQKFTREDAKGQKVPIDLVRIAEGQPYPLATVATPEWGGAADGAKDPSTRASMRIVAKDATSITFEGKSGQATIRKTLRLTGKPHELALELQASGPAAEGAGVVVLYPGYFPPETGSRGFLAGPPVEFVRPICRAGEETHRFDLGKGAATEPGVVQWAGMDQGYFVSALIPEPPAGQCAFADGPTKGAGLTAVRLPAQGGALTSSLKVYTGPKELDTLRGYGREFSTALDYGWAARPFALFARVLLYVLRWFEGLTHNWGVAIILLTVLVKVLLFPLTIAQIKSMNAMKALQPQVEALKAKHGDDKEKMNVAMMELYRQNKVNPFSGCLPLLLQMPIWFALYATLQTSVELYAEPFLWMADLTRKDPYYVFPIAMGISQFVMQKISPQPGDPAQAKMMLYFMPGFFTFMMLAVPGGLTLYIFVNNVLSIAQQQIMMRAMPAPTAPAKG
ncbi:MAG: membrane protein insertase YidC [Anaeromyxobacter sp.]